MAAVLEVRDVEAGYGRLKVLHGVRLAVPERSIVTVLGPNGAGKSTLLAVVAGLVEPTAGHVLLDGRDVTGEPPSRLADRGLCLIPEGRGIFPGLSVGENLRVAAAGGPVESAFEVFDVLRDRLDQRAGTLSGGEQQMLAMARALLRRPRVLLLDELSLGLAPRVVDDLYDAVRDIHAGGCTVVLVEQYVRRALEIADLVVVMDNGRVRFAGEPGELEHAPRSLASYLEGVAT